MATRLIHPVFARSALAQHQHQAGLFYVSLHVIELKPGGEIAFPLRAEPVKHLSAALAIAERATKYGQVSTTPARPITLEASIDRPGVLVVEAHPVLKKGRKGPRLFTVTIARHNLPEEYWPLSALSLPPLEPNYTMPS